MAETEDHPDLEITVCVHLRQAYTLTGARSLADPAACHLGEHLANALIHTVFPAPRAGQERIFGRGGTNATN